MSSSILVKWNWKFVYVEAIIIFYSIRPFAIFNSLFILIHTFNPLVNSKLLHFLASSFEGLKFETQSILLFFVFWFIAIWCSIFQKLSCQLFHLIRINLFPTHCFSQRSMRTNRLTVNFNLFPLEIYNYFPSFYFFNLL